MKAYDKNWSEPESKEQTWRTRIPDEEITLLKQEKAKKILDLGCGDGTTIAYLSSLNFNMTGMDYSEVGINKAKEKANARFVLGDIYEPLPFRDERFDAVISYQVVNHNTIEKIRELFKELHRIIKQDGILSVKVADANTYGYEIKDGLYHDEFGSVFEKIAPQTFLPVKGHEKGIIHYDFTEAVFLEEIEQAGFILLNKRHIGCHILANFRRK
jgi:ubiquinone/menaquinone biosynthesis C-methylase UbiE